MSRELSLIIPAYNEEGRIPRAFEGITNFFQPKNFNPEVIVVCDGCSDNTADVSRDNLEATDFPYRVIEYPTNKGKGAALQVGMLEASGTYRVFTDADLAAPLETLEKFFPYFEEKCPLIFGSRKLEGAEIKQHQPWYREQMGKIFTTVSNIILGTTVSDFTCGLKAFRHDIAERIFSQLKIKGWAFDAEIAFLAKKYNYRIEEIPVIWSDVEGTKVNPFKEALYSFRDLLRIRLNELQGKY